MRLSLGDRTVKRLDASEVDQFYRALQRQASLSPTSVSHIHAILSKAFAQAVRWAGKRSRRSQDIPRRPRRLANRLGLPHRSGGCLPRPEASEPGSVLERMQALRSGSRLRVALASRTGGRQLSTGSSEAAGRKSAGWPCASAGARSGADGAPAGEGPCWPSLSKVMSTCSYSLWRCALA